MVLASPDPLKHLHFLNDNGFDCYNVQNKIDIFRKRLGSQGQIDAPSSSKMINPLAILVNGGKRDSEPTINAPTIDTF